MEEATKKYNQKVASRNSQIYKLSLLGWTQEEIAEKVGLSGRSSVNKVLKKFDVEEIQQAFENGKAIDVFHQIYVIAEKVGLSQNRVSEIIGKFDVEEIDNACLDVCFLISGPITDSNFSIRDPISDWAIPVFLQTKSRKYCS